MVNEKEWVSILKAIYLSTLIIVFCGVQNSATTSPSRSHPSFSIGNSSLCTNLKPHLTTSEGNEEFVMIDAQKVIQEEALAIARSARPSKKKVLIVRPFELLCHQKCRSKRGL